MKRLKARGEGDGRGRDGYSITDSVNMNLSKLWEIVKDRLLHSMGSQKVGHDLATE